jgi:hypothetical protein
MIPTSGILPPLALARDYTGTGGMGKGGLSFPAPAASLPRMIALLLTLILGLIAALHLLWAVGFWFPIRDEAALARAVVGARGITKMPGAGPCALVAMALVFLISVIHWPDVAARLWLLRAAAAVFLLRGVATYTPGWRGIVPEQPFARLDQRIYGPLCLVIGAGLLAV